MLTPAQRSYCMSQIRSKDTVPEMIVRRTAFSMGYRYRLHAKHLPGKPDLAFPSRRKVIFVHGCFWHRHCCRYGTVVPKTRTKFWSDKFAGNKQRDKKNLKSLRSGGWGVLVIWECQVNDLDKLRAVLRSFLDR